MQLPDLFLQGQDAEVTLAVEGTTLQAGDTVRAQLRASLTGPVVQDLAGHASISGQTVTLRIPGALSAAWAVNAGSFLLHTTVLIVAANGAHRLAVPLTLLWQASYTRTP